MRYQLTDVHVRLLRGIRTLIASDAELGRWLDGAEAPHLVIEAFDSEPWASLTFTGTRHRLDLRLQGPVGDVAKAAARVRQLLKDPALDLPGHFLAEIETEEKSPEAGGQGCVQVAIAVEALTIVE